MSAAKRGDSAASRPRTRVRIRRVRKRDGREVPYDKRKIESAVAKAMQSVGESDTSFASEVADIVELTLVDRGSTGPARPDGDELVEVFPEIEEIQDLVERALVELGRAAVAKAYILYRDRRTRSRNVLNERQAGEGPSRSTRVRVREAEGTAPWDKGRVIAALMDEAELPRRTAEDVAARVEERVLSSGVRTVTGSLVRELVAGELLELGLDAALLRNAPVALARHDLRAILRDPVTEAWDEATGLPDRQPEALRAARAGSERVGGEVLARYAAEDILGAGSAELHRTGDVEVVDMASPHRPLTVSIPSDLLLEGEPGADGPFRVLGAVGDLLRCVGRGVVLEEPGPLCAPLVRSARDRGAAGLSAFLSALTALSRASGRSVGLGSPGPRHAVLTGRLVQELDEIGANPFAPTLFLQGEDLEVALDAGLHDELERLFARGRLVATFAGRDRRCVAPGCHRMKRERGALVASGAVALNLPRLARRAGPWREERFLEALADLVRCAVEICSSLHTFQSSLPGFLPPRLAARPSFALVPVGLREALRVIGDGDLDADRGARVLGLIAEAARRFAPPALRGSCRALSSAIAPALGWLGSIDAMSPTEGNAGSSPMQSFVAKAAPRRAAPTPRATA